MIIIRFHIRKNANMNILSKLFCIFSDNCILIKVTFPLFFNKESMHKSGPFLVPIRSR